MGQSPKNLALPTSIPRGFAVLELPIKAQRKDCCSIKPTGDMLFLQQAFQQPAEDIAEENLTIALVPPPGGTTPSSTAIPALSQLERAEGLSMSRKALAERLAISAAMIRSTKIGVYETELENHLEAYVDPLIQQTLELNPRWIYTASKISQSCCSSSKRCQARTPSSNTRVSCYQYASVSTWCVADYV